MSNKNFEKYTQTDSYIAFSSWRTPVYRVAQLDILKLGEGAFHTEMIFQNLKYAIFRLFLKKKKGIKNICPPPSYATAYYKSYRVTSNTWQSFYVTL